MGRTSSSSTAGPRSAGSVERGDSAYLALEDHAAIGNGRTVGLVGRDGGVDWCCLPRFDPPFTLERLLDARREGFFALAEGAAEARALFERLAARVSDVGLLSEQIDPGSGLFPQAFSHAVLIRAAVALEEACG